MAHMNKMIKKQLILPILLTLVMTITPAVAGEIILSKDEQRYPNSESPHILISGILLFMGIITVLAKYNIMKKLSSVTTRQFLKTMMAKNPRLKKFEKELNNPATVHYLSALIAKRLQESKIYNKDLNKALVKINETIYIPMHEKDIIKKLKSVCDEVVGVFKEYAKENPKFVDEVIGTLLEHKKGNNVQIFEYQHPGR